jgi:organic radical activating enzyme
MIHRNRLEFFVTDHCQLRCRNCATLSEYSPVKFASLDSFQKDIDALAKVMKVELFRFIGGEPLLHKNIVDFIKIVRESGIASTIAVVTNGQFIERQPKELFSVVDEIHISAYPGTTFDYKNILKFLECDRDVIDLPNGIWFHTWKTSQGTTVIYTPFDEFGVFFLPYKRTEAETQDTYNKCPVAYEWGCHVIRDGYYYKCVKPFLQKRYNIEHNLEVEFDYEVVDGIPLHEENLEERMNTYLQSKTPLKSCYSCTALLGEKLPHIQMPMKRPAGY